MAVDCFAAGPIGCACTTALFLQPEWTKPEDTRYSDNQKCYPPANALDNIADAIFKSIEGMLANVFNSVGDFFSDVFDGGNAQSPQMKFQAADKAIIEKCRQGNLNDQGLAGQCFFDRVHDICHSDDLYQDFVAAHGVDESEFANIHIKDRQTLSGILSNLDLYEQPLALCRQADQMSLDMVIEACAIAMVAGNQRTGEGGMGCNNKQSKDLQFEIKTSQWYLTKIRFSFEVPPPPPPPQSVLVTALVTEFDGPFYNSFAHTMRGWYPPVEALFTNNRTELAKYDADVMGSARAYNIQKSRVIIALRGMKKDSHAARMLTGLYTGTWAIGCEKLHKALNDPELARAGTPPTDNTQSPPPPPPQGVGGGFRPGDYSPPYDRNLLLYWSTIFYTSWTRQPRWDFEPLNIHSQFCDEPCKWQEVAPLVSDGSKQSVVDTALVGSTTKTNAMRKRCTEFSPILNYGSMQQLRDIAGGRGALSASMHAEDITLASVVNDGQRVAAVNPSATMIRSDDNGFPEQFQGSKFCMNDGKLRKQTEHMCNSLVQPPVSLSTLPHKDRSNADYNKFEDNNLVQRGSHYDMAAPKGSKGVDIESDRYRSSTLNGWYYVTSDGVGDKRTTKGAGMVTRQYLRAFLPTCAEYHSLTQNGQASRPSRLLSNWTRFMTAREFMVNNDFCTQYLDTGPPPAPPPSPAPAPPPNPPPPTPPPFPPPPMHASLSDLRELMMQIEQPFCNSVYETSIDVRCA